MHQGSSLKDTSGIQEETGVWHQGESWGTPFSHTERQAEAIVPFLNHSVTQPQSWQAGATSEAPSTLLTLFAPPWRSPEALPHPTYGSTQAMNSDFYILMAGLGDSQVKPSCEPRQAAASAGPGPLSKRYRGCCLTEASCCLFKRI